jgi:predicted CoA-binding protein
MSLAEQQRQQKEIEKILAERLHILGVGNASECEREAFTLVYSLLEHGFMIKKEKEPMVNEDEIRERGGMT